MTIEIWHWLMNLSAKPTNSLVLKQRVVIPNKVRDLFERSTYIKLKQNNKGMKKGIITILIFTLSLTFISCERRKVILIWNNTEFRKGDKVEIIETRPISKDKRFKVVTHAKAGQE